MVYFYFDIGILSCLLVFNFVVDQGNELVSHFVWRNKQFLELDWIVRTFDEIENRMYILHDTWSSRHQHTVGVHASITLMEVSGTDTCYIRSFFHLDMRNL